MATIKVCNLEQTRCIQTDAHGKGLPVALQEAKPPLLLFSLGSRPELSLSKNTKKKPEEPQLLLF